MLSQAFLTLAVTIAVFILKFALGFNTDPRHLRYFRGRPGLLFRSLLAVVVLVPLIALATVEILDPSRAVTVALLLLSASPGAPVAPYKVYKAKGNYAYAISLQFWATLLAVFSLPAWLAVFGRFYRLDMAALPETVAVQLAYAVLLPLGLGVLARRLRPSWSERFGPLLAKVANGLLALFGLALLIALYRLLLQTEYLTFLSFAVFLLLALAVGHGLGGPEPKGRTSLATMTSSRNLGIAMFVALQNAEQPRVLAMVIPYLVVLLLVNTGYAAWRKKIG